MADALETLGTIIGPEAGRDAVHVAVLPVVAAHTMRPGDHVGVTSDGMATATTGKSIGIVDPFLSGMVKAGERFWLFIYPRKITGLRHVWTHPDLPDEDDEAVPSVSGYTKEESEEWLRDFASRCDGPNEYEVLLAAASGESHPALYGPCRNDGEYLVINGMDAGGEIPNEFWTHVENIKGKKFPRARYFSCTC